MHKGRRFVRSIWGRQTFKHVSHAHAYLPGRWLVILIRKLDIFMTIICLRIFKYLKLFCGIKAEPSRLDTFDFNCNFHLRMQINYRRWVRKRRVVIKNSFFFAPPRVHWFTGVALICNNWKLVVVQHKRACVKSRKKLDPISVDVRSSLDISWLTRAYVCAFCWKPRAFENQIVLCTRMEYKLICRWRVLREEKFEPTPAFEF